MVLGRVVAVVAAAPLGGQSIADRVSIVRDGAVEMTYMSRPEACGDGRDVTALGRLYMVYPSVQGHGWSRMDCVHGAARVVVTRRDGQTTLVRTHIGTARSGADAGTTDLGVVSARDAAAYFLEVATSAEGRAASTAIMAAAFADSADIWRRLLSLARDGNRARDVRSAALFWLGGVAPAEAAEPLASIARAENEPRPLREGVLMTLGELRGGAGVPALIEMTRRDEGTRWLRERAIFWLGNAQDERGRTTLRTLASSDTVARNLREGAIFALGFVDERGTNGAFLRGLYPRLDDVPLRNKVIQALAQSDDDADQRWLVERVLDTREPMDLRKQALFWRGQRSDASLGDLLTLYPRLDSRELREHWVFVLSQRRESAAVDKLIDLATNEPDHAIRAKAVFWLGQSRDPRAAKFLEERISR
jgi:HEAT repeat protein